MKLPNIVRSMKLSYPHDLGIASSSPREQMWLCSLPFGNFPQVHRFFFLTLFFPLKIILAL